MNPVHRDRIGAWRLARAAGRCASVLAVGTLFIACGDRASEPEGADVQEPPPSMTVEPAEVLSTDPLTTIYGSPEPACPGCSVRLEPVGEFGRLEDSILLRDIPYHVERDSRGRFYAIPHHSEHELILYEPDGTIVRTVGRRGSGPGEFHALEDVRVGPADSVYVLHRATISTFDSAGRHASTVRLDPPPLGWRDARLVAIVDPAEEGGRYLVNMPYDGGDLPSRPLHLFDVEGRYVRSFGPPGLGEARRPGSGVLRRTALGHDGSIWLSEGSYRLEKVGMDGGVRRIIGVADHAAARWWGAPLLMTREEAEQYYADAVLPGGAGIRGDRPHRYPDGPRYPPDSRVEGFVDRGQDLIAVVLWTASSNWQEATIEYDPRWPQGRTALPGWHQQRYDTVVDVIHVPTGTVLTRTERLPGIAFIASDGTVLFPRVTDIGLITAAAFELKIEIPAGELPDERNGAAEAASEFGDGGVSEDP